MSEKTLSDGHVTQSVKAVVELLNFLGKASDPLPGLVMLANGVQLIKSSKCDCYYVTSPESCTCPGFHYNRTCKHFNSMQSIKPRGQRVVVDAKAACEESRQQAREYQAKQRELAEKAKKGPIESVSSIRPAGKWPGGHNGPVDPEGVA